MSLESIAGFRSDSSLPEDRQPVPSVGGHWLITSSGLVRLGRTVQTGLVLANAASLIVEDVNGGDPYSVTSKKGDCRKGCQLGPS